MRITEVEVIELRVPGWDASTFDGSYDNCVIRVHTDQGVCGLGEVDSVPSVIRAIVGAPASHTHAMGLRAVLLGQDPSDIEALWERMYDATSYYGRRGVVSHAISAIDLALWDLRGKLLGRPVCELPGSRGGSGCSPTARSIRSATRRTRSGATSTAGSRSGCARSRSLPTRSGAPTSGIRRV